jgi:hypothetical protein
MVKSVKILGQSISLPLPGFFVNGVVNLIESIAYSTNRTITQDADDDPGVKCGGAIHQNKKDRIYGSL